MYLGICVWKLSPEIPSYCRPLIIFDVTLALHKCYNHTVLNVCVYISPPTSLLFLCNLLPFFMLSVLLVLPFSFSNKKILLYNSLDLIILNCCFQLYPCNLIDIFVTVLLRWSYYFQCCHYIKNINLGIPKMCIYLCLRDSESICHTIGLWNK